MKYVQAKQGRVFIARFDDSEHLLDELKSLIVKEDIKMGMVHLLGAISKSKLVLGPEEKAYPPKPSWWEFDDAREIFATAIIAWEDNEPKIHLHSAVGHYTESKVGCIRDVCEVYLTIEAVIQELVAPNVSRKLDTRYNASLLNFE